MSLSQMNIRRAQVLLHTLQQSGVVDYVVSPGSRNTPLILALEWLAEKLGHDGVRIHRILDERSAGFFALGLGRLKGVPAALICTSGSAAAHYFPAVIESAQSHVPLLVLSADRPQELRSVGSLQTIDQNKLYGSYARLFLDLGAPDLDGAKRDAWVSACGVRAVDAACGYNAGPVHLNLPFREPLWTQGEKPIDLELPPVVKRFSGQPTLSETQRSELWAQLRSVKRGVIVAGPRDNAWNESEALLAQRVEALAEHLGWPIIAEPGSGIRASLSESEFLIAPADVVLRGKKVAEALAPEFVLRFGKTPTSKVVRLWAAEHAAQTCVIESNPGWHDPDAVVTTVIQTSPLDCVTGLLKHREHHERDDAWLSRWQQSARYAEEQIDALSSNQFWEGAIVREVVGALPKQSLLHVANSMPIRDLDAMVKSFPNRTTVVHHRGANGIDGALSALMGEAAAVAQPAVLLCGDLTFLHDMGALTTAQKRREALTVVVIDNCGGGIFEHLPIASHPEAFERNFITPHDQNLVSLTQAAGLRGYEVTSLQALHDLLEEEVERPGMAVIVATTNRSENTQAHRDLWTAVQEGLEIELS